MYNNILSVYIATTVLYVIPYYMHCTTDTVPQRHPHCRAGAGQVLLLLFAPSALLAQ